MTHDYSNVREKIIRSRRFGSCEKCSGTMGHDFALGGTFCLNPKCSKPKGGVRL